MNYLKNKNLLIILCASLFVIGCSDDDDTTPDPVTTPTNTSTADQVFEISNRGASAYVFGFTSVENPELELIRGNTYEFKVNSPGHPFLINTTNTLGTSNTYDQGVTNNGTASGTISFTVPMNAPDLLWYNCEFHAPMAARIRIVDKDSTRAFQVGNNGSTSYTFSGGGLTAVENYDFTFKRGKTYTFDVDAVGHPFYINSTQGTGVANAYNDGVTNNGTESGLISFTVPQAAPNTLFYNCEFHGSMTGTISIID